MITALGFVVDMIPFLNSLPLGGRLKHCAATWNKVCQNNWVEDVVSSGYKIPFKYIPVQHYVPRNPVVTGSAHDILKDEASELLLKEAIASDNPATAVPKLGSPGKWRPILNLKKFNKSIKHYCIKM